MALFSLPRLRERGAAQLRVESYLGATRAASAKLANESAAYDAQKTYDVFLSHSALDAEVIYGLKLEIERYGVSVYVYWIEDPQARERVDATTAARLKVRMNNCKGLLYAASANANTSRWMPWELGYFYRTKNRVAIVPLEANDQTYFFRGFKGQEYLDLYPYVSVVAGQPRGLGSGVETTKRSRLFANGLNEGSSAGRPVECAGSELVVLVFEQDVGCGERSGGRCVNRNSWIVNRCGRCLMFHF